MTGIISLPASPLKRATSCTLMSIGVPRLIATENVESFLLLVISLHCDDSTPRLKLFLILTRILLRYSQRHQCSEKPTSHSPKGSTKGRYQEPSRECDAERWNKKGSHCSQHATNNTASEHSCRFI